MKTFIKTTFLLVILYPLLTSANPQGGWIEYELEHTYNADWMRTIGTSTIIYVEQDSGLVMAFDTYNHKWQKEEIDYQGQWLDTRAGDKTALAWTDSFIVVYNALNQQFSILEYEGTILSQNNAPYYVPLCSGFMAFVITTEKVYVFNGQTNTWYPFEFTKPDGEENFNYGIYSNANSYGLFNLSSMSGTGTIVQTTYSAITNTFSEHSATNANFTLLDNGFATWTNQGVEDYEYYFGGYLAQTGEFIIEYPGKYFDAHGNGNEFLKNPKCMIFNYIIFEDGVPYGMRYLYTFNTDYTNMAVMSYQDYYGTEGWNNHGEYCGSKMGLILREYLPSHLMDAFIYDGASHTYLHTDLNMANQGTKTGQYIGGSYFSAYDPNVLLNWSLESKTSTICGLPTAPEGYSNWMQVNLNDYWNVIVCNHALSDSINFYSFNTQTGQLQYQYGFSSLSGVNINKENIYSYKLRNSGQEDRYIFYLPGGDLWLEFNAQNDAKFSSMRDFLYLYDERDNSIKLWDGLTAVQSTVPVNWNNSYRFTTHLIGYDNFLIVHDDQNTLYAYSTFTHDLITYSLDNFSKSHYGNQKIAILLPETGSYLTYNAQYNCFVPMELTEQQGAQRNIYWGTDPGSETALIITANGSLLAFDPHISATALEDNSNSGISQTISFELKQNYPNPFNPVTKIEYSVPAAAHIKLEIFDITGRSVATLVNAKKMPGNYEVVFDGSELASGMYLYHLKTDAFSKTKKMLILK